MADIQWSPKGKQPLVALCGIDFEDHFFEEREQSTMPVEWWFKDEKGTNFYWDETEVLSLLIASESVLDKFFQLYNSTGRQIGKYVRQSSIFRRYALPLN